MSKNHVIIVCKIVSRTVQIQQKEVLLWEYSTYNSGPIYLTKNTKIWNKVFRTKCIRRICERNRVWKYVWNWSKIWQTHLDLFHNIWGAKAWNFLIKATPAELLCSRNIKFLNLLGCTVPFRSTVLVLYPNLDVTI